MTKKVINFCIGLVLAASCFLFWGTRWGLAAWSDLSADEVLFQLTNSLQGTAKGMIVAFILNVIFPCIVMFAFIFIMRKSIPLKWWRIFTCMITIAMIICSVVRVNRALRLDLYFQRSNFIEENYYNPESVMVTFPEKKRNLIYIYLESMEVTYADKDNGGAFEYNIIPELTVLAKEEECFSDYGLNGGIALPGSTWTTGAMFAESTALPLKIDIEDNEMNSQTSFFEGVLSIGDILEKEGYDQELLIGSDADFGGRGLFYYDHGKYQILDYEFAKKTGWIDPHYYVWWGYEDKKLFQFAKERLMDLSDQNQPFNLTLLTADTHFEDGYICDVCEDEFDDQYANVIACSSKQVEQFVRWCQKQPFYSDTTIVISGDHPTMDSDFCRNVDSNYQRKVYTVIINSSEKDRMNYRDYSTFDLFPTTLAALGADIDGDRLGLGTNLYSKQKTLLEEYGYNHLFCELSKQSPLMNELAAIDDNKTQLKKDAKLPWANIEVTNYDLDKNSITVEISDIVNADAFIDKVFIRYGDNPFSLGEKLYCELDADGIYRTDIKFDSLDSYNGSIVAYATMDNKDISIGEIEGDLRFQNDKSLDKYLELAEKGNCAIIMSVRDEAAASFSEDNYGSFKKLGLTTNLANYCRNSFVAIVSSQGVYENVSDKLITYIGTIGDNQSLQMKVVSAGYESGDMSSIIIGDKDYSANKVGLNIVLYDENTNKVLDSKNFNTNDNGMSELKIIREDSEKIEVETEILHYVDLDSYDGAFLRIWNPASPKDYKDIELVRVESDEIKCYGSISIEDINSDELIMSLYVRHFLGDIYREAQLHIINKDGHWIMVKDNAEFWGL